MLGEFTVVENYYNSATAPAINQDEGSASNDEYPVPENGDTGGLEAIAMYGDMAAYEQYFPIGFFDVLSSTIPEWK